VATLRLFRYWGKRDTKLILPTNSSLSVTLDQDNLRSTTTARADASFTKDRLWLNGIEEEIKAGGRLATCLLELRKYRAELDTKEGAKVGSITSGHSILSLRDLDR
jgi:diphosphomevalonate decarboxylase